MEVTYVNPTRPVDTQQHIPTVCALVPKADGQGQLLSCHTFVFLNFVFAITARPLYQPPPLGALLFILLLTLFGFMWVSRMEEGYKQANGNQKAYANPAAIHPFWIRIRTFNLIIDVLDQINYLVTLSIPENKPYRVIIVLLMLRNLSFLGSLYFGACTPLPPRTSKFKQWLDQVKGFFAKEAGGIGSPVPV